MQPLLLPLIASTLLVGAPDTVEPPSLAVSFMPNQGQWDERSLFAARCGLVLAHLERDAIVLRTGSQEAADVLRLAFLGSSGEGAVTGEGPQGARHHFLRGPDPDEWRRDVPGYDAVLYRDLYPGIDLRLRDGGGRLEYDLLLAPGSDLAGVQVDCEGVESTVPH